MSLASQFQLDRTMIKMSLVKSFSLGCALNMQKLKNLLTISLCKHQGADCFRHYASVNLSRRSALYYAIIQQFPDDCVILKHVCSCSN